MRTRSLISTVTEQASASLLTFLGFFVAARFLPAAEVAIYSAAFSLNQSYAFFLFGWVLLPVSSASGEDADKQIGVSVTLLALLVLAFMGTVHLFAPLFSAFGDGVPSSVELWLYLFFGTQCLHESSRWICIRKVGVRAALWGTTGRLLVFVLLAFSMLGTIADWPVVACSLMKFHVIANTFAVCAYAFALRREIGSVRPRWLDRRAFKHAAIGGNSAASSALNFATLSMVDRGLGGGGLAAYQAIKSLVNPIGVIGQIFDNHVAARWARGGSQVHWSARFVITAAALSIALVVLTVFFAKWLLGSIYGGEMVGYWLLLPILAAGSLAHVGTRPLLIRWRVEGDTVALNRFTLLCVMAGLPLLLGLGALDLPYAVVVVSALTPLLALLLGRGASRMHSTRETA